MLVEQIDRLDLEPRQRGLNDLPDMLGPAVHARQRARRGIDGEAELGGDHDLVAHRRERLADQLFVRERAVRLGRIEEGHAALDGRPHEGDRLLLVGGWAEAVAEAHRTVSPVRVLKKHRSRRGPPRWRWPLPGNCRGQ